MYCIHNNKNNTNRKKNTLVAKKNRKTNMKELEKEQ
jgi:hypothetical protein